ncbi:MAG TPA: hypothetical protein VIG62_19630 [Blastocatellia bacterium]
MSDLIRLTIRSLFLLAVFSLSLTTAHAQSARPPDEITLRSLLNEVRLLRETLQWTNLNAHRSQIIVERIRSQNDRVARITRMLEDTRDQIANLQVQTTQMSEQAKSSESELDREADSNRRTAMEAELKGFKQIIEPLKQRLEQLKERETRLNLELQTEQGKLNELEGRLEGLEREIESEIEKQREASGEKKGNNK